MILTFEIEQTKKGKTIKMTSKEQSVTGCRLDVGLHSYKEKKSHSATSGSDISRQPH